jgi:protein SCO1
MALPWIVILLFALSSMSFGQSESPAIPSPQAIKDDMGQGLYTSYQTPPILRQVGIDQNLGAALPLDVELRDESGATVHLGDYFNHGRPVLILPVYYRCPMLCTMELNSLLINLKLLTFSPGKEFEIVTFSFDPRETPKNAADKKSAYMREYKRDGADKGWHFLTADEPNIKRLTGAIGFHYAYDKASDQYAHASGLMIATPQGKLSRYYYGVNFDARDLRLGMIEASDEKIGTLADAVLLYCFHYDPTQGKYGLVVMNVVRAGGALTLVGVGAMLFFLTRRAKLNMSRLAASQKEELSPTDPNPLTH